MVHDKHCKLTLRLFIQAMIVIGITPRLYAPIKRPGQCLIKEKAMFAKQLKSNEADTVIRALDECYRRLKAADISAKELTQDGFTLMFKSAYQTVATKRRH